MNVKVKSIDGVNTTFFVKKIPPRYEVLEYIKSDGTNYINTKYIPSDNNMVKLDISMDTQMIN